ncbi:hypothetical protein KDA_65060 [Dictyobacter alpinus]|uniref:Uncharacterized protein n=1 Tax=Dictyobacter alpinus TaxID=2014873 RepID=A0A402BIG2_9CHLR|nr:hypothetical protein KDA_65060 [Dictyobacter alpinus]
MVHETPAHATAPMALVQPVGPHLIGRFFPQIPLSLHLYEESVPYIRNGFAFPKVKMTSLRRII